MLLHKKNLLNLLLTFIVTALGTILYFGVSSELPKVTSQPAQQYETATPKENGVARQPLPPAAAYNAVVKQSLFSPERKEFVPEQKTDESVNEKANQEKLKTPGNGIELQGIIAIGTKKNALIFNPANKLQRNQQWVSVGDKIDNMIVTHITVDTLTLQQGTKKYLIKLRDKKKNTRSVTKTGNNSRPTKKRPRVVSTGSSARSGKAKESLTSNESAKARKKKVIHTPFGDIIRNE